MTVLGRWSIVAVCLPGGGREGGRLSGEGSWDTLMKVEIMCGVCGVWECLGVCRYVKVACVSSVCGLCTPLLFISAPRPAASATRHVSTLQFQRLIPHSHTHPPSHQPPPEPPPARPARPARPRDEHGSALLHESELGEESRTARASRGVALWVAWAPWRAAAVRHFLRMPGFVS